MSMKEKTHFVVDKLKCIRCGKCKNVCSGMVIDYDAEGYLYMKDFERFGWRGCWKCQHCLGVCHQGAPHLFIAHEKCVGKWAEDSKVNCNIATAYFELLCNAYGLGTTIMSYPAEVLNELAPEARKMLGIPDNHYTKLIVGFGYPEITYARGVQKERKNKIHRYSEGR